MKLKGILSFAHQLLEDAVEPGDIVVDATAGNGHDTLFLAKLTGSNGHVFGFDIQQEAIKEAQSRITREGLTNVTLVNQGHETLAQVIPQQLHGKISCACFNLGYLPGGDKKIVTQSNTTIEAIEQLLSIMKKEGIIVLVVYPGHPEGELERDQVLGYVKKINQKEVHVLQYQFINQVNNPPFIIAIEKR